MKLKVSNKKVTLQELPKGSLFMCGDTLGLKSEYGDNDGWIDAYIVGSGEFFSGGVVSPMCQRNIKVYPVKVKM